MKNKQPYATCPGCGSTDFLIDGYVGHVQPYDAKLSEFGVSKMVWDDDYPTGARCATCEKDVTELFKKFGILGFYRLEWHDR